MLRKQSINDAQSATVDLHFSELIDDISVIDETHREFTKDDLPEWFDKKLFKAGQDYYCRNLLGSGMSAMCGLLAVLIIPSILRVLIWTKKSGTPCTAFSRYLETLLHTYYLFASDIDDPNSRFWKSINEIRYMHSTSSRKSRNAGIGGITQRDMALTQFGFMGYALIAPEKLALTNEKHEREGLNHFWRIVGHAIGISDRLNICRKNEVETTELCRRLNKEVFGPHMKNRPVNFPEMAGAMLDGMWCVDPVLNYDSFMSFWYDLSGLSYDKPLGLVSRVNSAYRACILYLMATPGIGFLVRNWFNYYLRFNYWLLEHWRIIGCIRFGKKQSEIHLYRK